MGEGLPFAPKAVKRLAQGNILQIISLNGRNCEEVIVIDGKYFPEIHRPEAGFEHQRPVYDKTQLNPWRLRGVTSNAQN